MTFSLFVFSAFHMFENWSNWGQLHLSKSIILLNLTWRSIFLFPWNRFIRIWEFTTSIIYPSVFIVFARISRALSFSKDGRLLWGGQRVQIIIIHRIFQSIRLHPSRKWCKLNWCRINLIFRNHLFIWSFYNRICIWLPIADEIWSLM